MGAGTGKPTYTTVPASFEDDREAIIALWNRGLTREGAAEAKLRWYYERNPAGMAQMAFLACDGCPGVVGVATMAPRRMRFGTECLVAGCLVDFVVEPDHRSFFPALMLQKTLLRSGRATHAVAFGTPNRQSEAVMRRAGYRCIGQMVRRVRVVRSRDYLARFIPAWLSGLLAPAIDGALRASGAWSAFRHPGYACEWRDRPDAQFDALWERIAPPRTLIGVRDSAFLTWRFVESPLESHRFFVVVSKAERRLVGYAVCHVRDNAVHVGDFLVDPQAPHAGERLFLELAREAYRAGHRSVSFQFLGNEAVRRQLGGLWTVTRGERPLYAAFDERFDLASPSSWYVTNADEDG
jgi:hypothetical protein